MTKSSLKSKVAIILVGSRVSTQLLCLCSFTIQIERLATILDYYAVVVVPKVSMGQMSSNKISLASTVLKNVLLLLYLQIQISSQIQVNLTKALLLLLVSTRVSQVITTYIYMFTGLSLNYLCFGESLNSDVDLKISYTRLAMLILA
jgi:hypothetical protein